MTARDFRAWHVPGRPLVLPNAWDAASARAVEAAGFAAVATSSAAVAATLGYADGEATPPGEMFDAIARIAASVTVPVSADIERGYGLPPAELVERLLATGAVGCNLEDSSGGVLVPVDPQVEFLASVREAAGCNLVLNARIDVFLHGSSADVGSAVERARRYFEAGADCVYPITAPVEALAPIVAVGPVNALGRVGQPRDELVRLGVARISYGSGIFNAAATFIGGLLDDLR